MNTIQALLTLLIVLNVYHWVERNRDDNIIQKNEMINIAEDGNTLRGLGARGYIVKCFDGHKLVELFSCLKNIDNHWNLIIESWTVLILVWMHIIHSNNLLR